MADTTTTNLSLTKPEVGASTDTWGTKINNDLDALDAIFSATGTAVNVKFTSANFDDNAKAIFGTGDDLQIFHDGSDSYVNSNGADLRLKADDVKIYNYAGTEVKAIFTTDGSVDLYHNNVKKFETSATGATVTGTLVSDAIGINTASPDKKLNVIDSAALQAEFSGYSHASAANNSRVASGSIRLGNGDGTTGLLLDYTDQGQTLGLIKNEYVSDAASELRLQSPFLSFYTGTSASERMRIDSSGNLGINTTSPTAAFKFTIDAGANHGGRINNIGNGYSGIVTKANSSNNYFPMYFENNAGGGVGYILSDSTSTVFSVNASDIFYKENIKDWDENVSESFKNIKPVIFNYKSDENKKEVKGYIAQNEVDKFPEAYPINPKDGKRWFNPSGMTVYLMKAIQEQQEQIEALQSEINTLKGE